MVESHPVCFGFFFILAGYMAAVGRYGRVTGSVAGCSVAYLKKKAVQFYPLHITTFLLNCMLLVLAPQHAGYAPADAEEGSWKALLNLLLLQDWSWERDIKFCFNGVSWFLSALLFCFMLTPLLLRGAESIIRHMGRGAALVALVASACLKLPLYIFDTNLGISADVTEIFVFDAHSWPPFRLIDYFIGLCAGIWWRLTPAFHTSGRRAECISCLLISGAVLALLVYDWLPQPVALVLIAGGLYGATVSKCSCVQWLRSRPMVFLGTLVMPVYLLHNVLLKYARWADVPVHRHSVAFLALLVCLVVAFCWQVAEKRIRLFAARR